MALEIIQLQTAEEFVRELERLPREISDPDFSNPWVYRGQSDAAWALEPSAWHFRGQGKLRPLLDWLRPKVNRAIARHRIFEAWAVDAKEQLLTIAAQTAAEVIAVRQFCDLADELGIAVPGADRLPGVTDAIGLAIADVAQPPTFEEGAYSSLFPSDTPYALAQHHGVPTRYLDWTREPLVAAFFAAWDVGATAKELCVWATNPDGVVGVRWATVPRAQHGYLHAQSGLFSCLPRRALGRDMTKWPTLDSVLCQDGYPLRKYTLPARYHSELLRVLFAKHISRAHLMPVLDNVAQVSIDRWQWLQGNRCSDEVATGE